MIPLIAINVTEEQATLFRLLMSRYDVIKFMADEGCFDIKRGDVTLHFGKQGELSSIEKRLFSYPQMNSA